MAEDFTYGKFVIEPLERGYGLLWEFLRRVLFLHFRELRSIPSKIDGAARVFNSIPGVVEDVTEIILNIKELSLKVHSEGQKVVYIDYEGDGEIKAGDIKTDADVEILNPDLHIATISGNHRLYMELMVDTGRGYVPAEKNKKPNQPIGIIPIDSIYTPVKKG